MENVDVCGITTSKSVKDDVYELAIRPEWKSLLEIVNAHCQSKNRIQTIVGDAFKDGQSKGVFEGEVKLYHFLLDIQRNSCNNKA